MTTDGNYAYHLRMTKTQAIKMFKTVPALAAALGISRQAIYQWPERLSQRTADEIRGAAVRLGLTQNNRAA